MSGSLGFVNTQVFNEAARHWQKHKRYDDGDPGTLYHRAYWNEEIRRCQEGYTSGGVYITGYHYHYLNYCRIQIVERTYGEVHDIKVKVAAKREEAFPAFWDVDYSYFTAAEIAQNGMSLSVYKELPMDLHINEESLSGGRHLIWLKPRGVGASWKFASMCERNYAVFRGSKSYMLANDKTFLTEDGLWSKFLLFRDWQIAHAKGLGKRSDVKLDRNNMHIRASRLVNEVEVGFGSEVIGLSLNNDWQKARGKRGMLVGYEEFGKFPNANKAWTINRRSMEEGNKVYGLMLGFGTGGTKDANFEALKLMAYDPKTYNVLVFDNVWSEGAKPGDIFAMFTPATKNIAFVDKDGNSLESLAKEFLDSERAIAEQSTDSEHYPRTIAEDPYTPEEAVLVSGKNPFISKGLIEHAKRVELQKLYISMGVKGRFDRDEEGKIIFIRDSSLKPIYKHPPKQPGDTDTNLDGAAIIYQEPYRKNGKIPKGLYKLCADTYRHDQTTGVSVGAYYIIEQPNNFTPTKGDIIVGVYVGRPEFQEIYNKGLFDFAEYFEAEIAFENDEPGDIIGFAKRHRKTQMLAEEFQMAYSEEIKTSEKSKRNFGMHLGSGKENARKKQGDLFTKAWMYRIRGYRENGSPIHNYHTVYELGLLQEWISYGAGNFDRQSAFRVGMYHQQELEYNEEVPRDSNVIERDNFFERELF